MACAVTAGAESGSPRLLSRDRMEALLNNYVLQNRAKNVVFSVQPRVESFRVDDNSRKLTLVVSPVFASQDFTGQSVKFYYKRLAKSLPKPYNRYELSIESAGLPIEQMIPGAKDETAEKTALWGHINYDGMPWVLNESQPFFVSHGLFDRHISVWASHGIYYDNKKDKWKWQRPNLFCTTEDLFTQTIVVPYLIPMLENAGAVVFTPRERDWQRNEIIVDNDGTRGYYECDGKEDWQQAPEAGFAFHAGTYRDGENPFDCGTARIVKTVRKGRESWVSYQPSFPKSGRYAVYVSYQTVDGSIEDAKYIVMHKGERTVFRVNQQMGGGTWVYLGTFDFDEGDNEFNRVVVTNMSETRGYVSTDAVRFGGGMGNIQRAGTTSGMPRCLEGARYSAQWSGAPYDVYGGRGGSDDYSDDINTRSNMTNWLAGGSVYVPMSKGKNVPIELSLAVHSDAGYSTVKDSIIGSLSICTTNFNDGRLNSGVSRLVSRDFSEALLSGLKRDLTAKYGKWTRRYLWDRNYSETRRPEVPSAIIETMSHQNFADMRRGLDPNFRFTMARSLYKTILRYVSGGHGQPCVVQPLPVDNFRIERLDNNRLRLSWNPVGDELEPTAVPTAYNVYIAENDMDFDAGRIVRGNTMTFEAKRGVLYKFRVTAVNRGGESFPSETLAAYLSDAHNAKDVLVVNGFKRLSGPAVVDDGSRQGFDLDKDMGVSYGLTAGWNGRQQCFDRSRAGSEGPGALGYCGNELAGQFIMGNQLNESVCHVQDIAQAGRYNVLSCSLESLENGLVKPSHYNIVDLMFGLQKDDGHSLVHYKTFSEKLQTQLRAFVKGGGRMMVSGAYIGSDMTKPSERKFLADVLKVSLAGSVDASADNGVYGLSLNFDIIGKPNDTHFAASSVDALRPSSSSSFCAMKYSGGAQAAVAYDGNDYKCFSMGFPFECIGSTKVRQQVMKAVMDFLSK